MQSYVLVVEGLLVGVLSVSPAHWLLPVEVYEHEGAYCIEKHHEHKDRKLLGLVARDIDGGEQGYEDDMLVFVDDLLLFRRFACHVDRQEHQGVEKSDEQEEDGRVPIKYDVQSCISPCYQADILIVHVS